MAQGVHWSLGQMPDPFWLIVGFIAIACVLLFPQRLWMRSRHRAAAGGRRGSGAARPAGAP